MQVHQRSSVFHHPLSSVDEGLGKLYAVVNVVTAATPVKTALVITRLPTFVAVAVADLKVPLTAGPGDGVDYSS